MSQTLAESEERTVPNASQASFSSPTPPAPSRPRLKDASTLSLLHEVSQELTSILEPDELLAQIARKVYTLIGFEFFCLYEWDENQQQLVNRFSLRFGAPWHGAENLQLGQGVCGTAASMRQSIRVPDVSQEPRFVVCDPSIRSELAVPLLFKDRLIGVVNLESVHRDAFGECDEKVLQTLASSIAISMENARLYNQVRSQQKGLQDDLKMAREVQKGLLPQHSPWMDGLEIGRAYCPARQLGGDFYDFIRCSADNLSIAVGDVSGKATAAALYGSLAIGVLRAQVIQNPCSPAEILRHMNTHLLQPNLDNRFLAIAVANYDQRQRALTLANAGLPEPLLIRQGKVKPVKVHGIPLGMFADTRYEEETMVLQEGDTLVLCTDGLHESVNCLEEEFGEKRLSEVLLSLSSGNAQDIADGLLEASRKYSRCSDKLFEDDRTVVVLKVS